MRGLYRILAALFLGACHEPALVSDREILGDAIATPLTATSGDAVKGKALFITREQGHCILCHQVSGLDAEFQGNLGPALDGVGTRLTEGQLRLRIVDYDRVKPGTTMPSYYRAHNLNQVGQPFQNKPVLSAQDIEDIIAYLMSLKTETGS